MLDKAAFGLAVLLLSPACTVTEPSGPAEAVSIGSASHPYSGTSKDAEFLKNTPTAYRAFVEACEPWDDWEKPAPPFKIYGNTYHVGTCGISAILITGDQGHILIDSGTEAGANIVIANLRSLGIDLQEIELLLHSHEHFDHVGGMRKMMIATGGKVIASKPAAAVFFSGQAHPDDPQFGMHEPMTSFMPERHIEDGETEALGALRVTAIETPGHTPGALSWQWQSCEGERCLNLVYADSLSPVSADDYKFSDHPEYLEKYYEGLERLSRAECDILLTPHPSHSRMVKRMRTGSMIEPAACAYYAIGKANDIEERLKRETGGDQ